MGVAANMKAKMLPNRCLAIVPLPPELAVGPAYGMVLLHAKPVAARFATFVMSEAGQSILKAHGFDPVALVEPVPPSPGLLVQRAGLPSHVLSLEHIAALPPLAQRIGFTTGRGEQQNEWTGPLLWDVLVASGAIDPAKVAEQVRLSIRVTGPDGAADPGVDMVFKTGLRVTPGPACPGRPLSEAGIAELAAALDRSPLANTLFTLSGLMSSGLYNTQRRGVPNTSGTATLVWQIASGEIPPFQMTIRIIAPGQYGLGFHLRVRSRRLRGERTGQRLPAWL